MPDSNAPARPRLGWLALFQLLTTALVVLMARQTEPMFGPPLLEDALPRLSDEAGPPAVSGSRGWLPTLVAMTGRCS
jgi:hypothetical protein